MAICTSSMGEEHKISVKEMKNNGKATYSKKGSEEFAIDRFDKLLNSKGDILPSELD